MSLIIHSVFHATRECKLFQKSKAQENEARGSCLAVRILRYEVRKETESSQAQQGVLTMHIIWPFVDYKMSVVGGR